MDINRDEQKLSKQVILCVSQANELSRDQKEFDEDSTLSPLQNSKIVNHVSINDRDQNINSKSRSILLSPSEFQD